MQGPLDHDQERVDQDSLEQQDRSLRRLAQHLVGGLESDDLVQDTWLAAVESGWQGAPLEPRWLRGVLRKKALMTRRGNGRRRQREELLRSEASRRTTEDALEQSELCGLLLQAIERLREPERSVVRMRYLEQHSPASIALLLGRPEETVKGQLKRALAALREDWERKHGNEPGRSLLAILALGRRPRGQAANSSTAPALLGWMGGAVGLGLLYTWMAVGNGQLDGVSSRWLRADDQAQSVASPSSGVLSSGSRAASDAPLNEALPGRQPSGASAAASLPPEPGSTWRIQIVDPQGRPLEGAEVYANGPEHHVTSDAEGIASFSLAPDEPNQLAVGLLDHRFTFYAEHPAFLSSGAHPR